MWTGFGIGGQMKPIHDKMIKKQFNRLTVFEYVGESKHGHKQYKCKCKCGKETIAAGFMLRNGKTKSCGCLLQEYYKSGARQTHNKSHTRLYRIWANMKDRCLNEKGSHYKDYGERGITVCEEWQNDFMSFYKWATENGYKKGLEVDRINNDGNYSSLNCRWATRSDQNNNKRTTRIIAHGNEKMSIAQWARFFNIHPSTINSYVKLHDVSYENYINSRMNGGIKRVFRKKA